MSFDTYDNLQTEIKSWLKRDNMSATQVESFISLAEAEMNKTLRTRNQEVRESFTISSQFTDLTTLNNVIIEVRALELSTNPVIDLKYRNPSVIDREVPLNTTGKPLFYSIQGDELEVRPSPDSSYTAEITYYKPVPALSDSNTSNWVLTNHPDIYLWGCLYFGNLFIKDATEAQANKILFMAAMKDLNAIENKSRYPGGLNAKVKK